MLWIEVADESLRRKIIEVIFEFFERYDWTRNRVFGKNFLLKEYETAVGVKVAHLNVDQIGGEVIYVSGTYVSEGVDALAAVLYNNFSFDGNLNIEDSIISLNKTLTEYLSKMEIEIDQTYARSLYVSWSRDESSKNLDKPRN